MQVAGCKPTETSKLKIGPSRSEILKILETAINVFRKIIMKNSFTEYWIKFPRKYLWWRCVLWSSKQSSKESSHSLRDSPYSLTVPLTISLTLSLKLSSIPISPTLSITFSISVSFLRNFSLSNTLCNPLSLTLFNHNLVEGGGGNFTSVGFPLISQRQ